MSLKDTFKHLRSLLEAIQGDLEKAEEGNKAASQRVRTSTIRFEKAAKLFRKESVKAEKNGSFKKKKKGTAKAAPKVTAKPKAATKKAPAAPKRKAAPKKKATAAKRATAKLPKKKR